jgi:DNA-binding response OmpR family regulator
MSIEELSAAVQSLGLRLRADQALPVNQAQLSLQVEGLRAQGPLGSIELSAVEVALLTALVRAPGQRLAHWQLFAIINPGSEAAALSNLAVRMTRLRKKLADIGISGPTLQVVRHEGYQLCLPVKLL